MFDWYWLQLSTNINILKKIKIKKFYIRNIWENSGGRTETESESESSKLMILYKIIIMIRMMPVVFAVSGVYEYEII